jgi:hypothetical protein
MKNQGVEICRKKNEAARDLKTRDISKQQARRIIRMKNIF